MTRCPIDVDMKFGWQRIVEGPEIMYLVKRPSYEIFLAVSERSATHPPEERPLLHVHLKDQGRMPSLILEIGQMEDFFEGLSRLLEYVHVEETRRQGQL
jgi:hypothetical protein